MGDIRDAYKVSTDWLTVPRAALELAVHQNRISEWINRKEDPLPARLPPGNEKQVRIYRPEMDAWMLRNFNLLKEAEVA